MERRPGFSLRKRKTAAGWYLQRLKRSVGLSLKFVLVVLFNVPVLDIETVFRFVVSWIYPKAPSKLVAQP